MDYHADTKNIGKMAAAAGVGQVAFYHLVPPVQNVVMENIFMRGVPSDTILTHDGMRFLLPAGSDVLEIVEKN
jgi:ribonuclease Z